MIENVERLDRIRENVEMLELTSAATGMAQPRHSQDLILLMKLVDASIEQAETFRKFAKNIHSNNPIEGEPSFYNNLRGRAEAYTCAADYLEVALEKELKDKED